MFEDELDVVVDDDPVAIIDDEGDFVVNDDSPAEIGEGTDKALEAITPVADTTANPDASKTDSTTDNPVVDTTPADYGNDEEVPADWQTQAQKAGWNDVTTEQAFYEQIRAHNYIHQQYNSDPTVRRLHQLTTPTVTSDLDLVKYDIAQQMGEWAGEDDVEESLAKFRDDEGNLNAKGQKRAEIVRARLTQEFNKTLDTWATQAQTELTAERNFFGQLREKLNSEARLTSVQRQQAYQYIRSGQFATDSIIDPAKTDAHTTLERALWSNPATRQALLKPLLEAAEKDGASKVLQQLL